MFRDISEMIRNHMLILKQNSFNDSFLKSEMQKLHYYCEQAERCKQLYELTRNSSKMSYKLLSQIAKRLNKYYCDKGIEFGKESLAWALCEMKELIDTYNL